MAAGSKKRKLTQAGILLGMGLGAFIDGIVLHQILQWHHMLSDTRKYPTNTVAGLEMNTLADGLFHAAAYVLTIAGLLMLWQLLSQRPGPWSTRGFAGLLLMGWGVFNVVEGVIDHHLLQIHHVRDDVTNPALWDLGFLILSGLVLLVGWMMFKSADWKVSRESVPS